MGLFRHPRNTRKRAAMRFYVGLLRDLGYGDMTIMVASPNDPKEKIQKHIVYELDGVPISETVEEERYIHPVKTIDEWCKEWRL